MLVLAVLGLANLWMAIAADLGVSLLVVANALRLLRDRFEAAAARPGGGTPSCDPPRPRGVWPAARIDRV